MLFLRVNSNGGRSGASGEARPEKRSRKRGWPPPAESPQSAFEERFEIQATPGHSSTTDEQRLMLQKLLMERFGLKVHTGRREMPVYLLVTGKDGPKLGARRDNTDPGHRGINIESGVLIARSGTMDDFVGVLTTNLDRPVLNQTNLNGKYDFTLTWDQPPQTAVNGPRLAQLSSLRFASWGFAWIPQKRRSKRW